MAFIVQNFGNSNDDIFTNAKSSDIENEEYDFIIVGAGAAGCVLANRLTEIKQWKVLLLEAGGDQPLISDVPSMFRVLRGSSLDWKFKSEPELIACADDETHGFVMAQGKVMGESSSINGMAYERGFPEDYNDWARNGNVGWSYKDVLPYFMKSEDNRNSDILSKEPELHSTGGYQTVEKFPYEDKNTGVVKDAWRELNFSNVDYETPYQTTTIGGARQSSNGAFIRPIRGRRENLVIKTYSYVTKIIIDQRSRKAVGVEYSLNDDRVNLKRVYAKKEVIVSAGAFNSPKLLMLSGIGKKRHLRKSGIRVIKDLPVGDNLHDHVMLPTFVGILDNSSSTVVSAEEMQNDATYWLSTHQGTLSSIGSFRSTTTVVKIFNETNAPDLQFNYFFSMLDDIVATENYYGTPTYYPAAYDDSFAILPVVMKPKSRGTVRLNANNSIWSPPEIRLNLLTDQRDIDTIVEGAVLSQKIFETRAFKERNITIFDQPPALCKDFEFASRNYLECLAKNYAAPRLHFVGTCKMGPKGDATAIVNPRLKVHGIRRLRVIDSSIMPAITRGATVAPTIMIAEKGSDMIKGDWLSR